MKLKVFLYSFFILLILAIQTTILDYIAVRGVKPNVIIVFIIVCALLGGDAEGGTVGFFAGLALDLMSGGVIGFNAMLGYLLGVASGSVNKSMFRDNILVVLFFTFVYSIAYETVVYVYNNIMSGDLNLIYPLTRIILPEALYNCVSAIPVYALLLSVNRRSNKTGKKIRQY